VLGPNGFVRGFSGKAAMSGIDVTLVYQLLQRAIELRLANRGEMPAYLSLQSMVYGPITTRTISVAARGTRSVRWDVSACGNWYDLTLRTEGFVRQFAGRLETGKNSISDPAMGLA
jgi:phospholipase C